MYRKSFIDLYLNNGFSFEEAKSEIDFALEVLFNYTYKDFILGKALEKWKIDKLNNIIEERISTRRPLQQILGRTFFYGRLFFVDKYTLIPRPETEILVSEVLDITKQYKKTDVLDIGTGSGCIPITLMLENAKIFADSVDISDEAIETAKKNALFHNVCSGINIFKSDLFENVKKQYDIIVSNPPYIPLKEKNDLQIEVRDYDPPNALFTTDDFGIEYYDKIVTQADKYLKEEGYIAFEIGINQSEKVIELLKRNNYRIIKVLKDYNSIDRVIIAKK